MSEKFPKLKTWLDQTKQLFEGELHATMTAEEITRLSWAKLVRDLHEVPLVFRDQVESIANQMGQFPYIVVTPTYYGFLKRENLKLILFQEEKIGVLESSNNRVEATRYNIQDIHMIEVGDILLNGWLSIHGLDENGDLAIRKLSFNAVTYYLFQPFIDSFRCPSSYGVHSDLKPHLEKFHVLKQISFKYMNFAKRSLVPGNLLEQFIFQPEIRHPIIRMGRTQLFYRVLCYSHLLILTDQELIWIRDDVRRQNISSDTRYGGIWTFIPRRHITDLGISPGENGFSHLWLQLSPGDRLEIPIENEKIPEIETLTTRIKNPQKITSNHL
jgi:hypothetical protein